MPKTTKNYQNRQKSTQIAKNYQNRLIHSNYDFIVVFEFKSVFVHQQESLEGLQKQLKGIGLDPNTLNADVAMLSNQRIQNLEGSLNKLLETRQKKIEALEISLREVQDENCSLKQNIEVQKLKSGGDNLAIGKVHYFYSTFKKLYARWRN